MRLRMGRVLHAPRVSRDARETIRVQTTQQCGVLERTALYSPLPEAAMDQADLKQQTGSGFC